MWMLISHILKFVHSRKVQKYNYFEKKHYILFKWKIGCDRIWTGGSCSIQLLFLHVIIWSMYYGLYWYWFCTCILIFLHTSFVHCFPLNYSCPHAILLRLLSHDLVLAAHNWAYIVLMILGLSAYMHSLWFIY